MLNKIVCTNTDNELKDLQFIGPLPGFIKWYRRLDKQYSIIVDNHGNVGLESKYITKEPYIVRDYLRTNKEKLAGFRYKEAL